MFHTDNRSLPYKVEKIDISKDTQKEDWFLAINPNGRIPALTDKFTDGQTINLFESGSIMQYLVERYDTEYKISFPKGSREYYEVNNWLFFQNAGVGPMQGQASKYNLLLLKRRCIREHCQRPKNTSGEFARAKSDSRIEAQALRASASQYLGHPSIVCSGARIGVLILSPL